MKMQPIDSMGSLYSSAGLRFGGFQTKEFFGVTEELEDIRPGIREEIIAEAHYLCVWLHTFPEIGFFLGTIFSKSLLVGFLCFIVAHLLEIIRFYTFGSSPTLSFFCRLWNWMKIPLFIIAAIIFWPQSKIISIVFVIFLILQSKFMILSVIAMLPLKLFIQYFFVKKYGPEMGNMEGLALQYVVDRWHMKLKPNKIA